MISVRFPVYNSDCTSAIELALKNQMRPLRSYDVTCDVTGHCICLLHDLFTACMSVYLRKWRKISDVPNTCDTSKPVYTYNVCLMCPSRGVMMSLVTSLSRLPSSVSCLLECPLFLLLTSAWQGVHHFTTLAVLWLINPRIMQHACIVHREWDKKFEFTCKDERRAGNYETCFDSNVLPSAPCLVYSFGWV